MKKSCLILIAGLISYCTSYAQNIFPSTGNVGIGTTNPPVLVNIVAPISKYSTASPTFANIASFLSTNDSSAPFGLRTMLFGASEIPNRYVTLQTTDFQSLDGENIIFQPQAGNIGVGVLSPKVKLHISADGANELTTALQLEGGDGGQQSGTSLTFASAYNGGSWLSGRVGAFTTGYGLNYGSALVFHTNNGSSVNSLFEAMRITSNGAIGIGTSTPDAKLAVKGTIHTQEVKVDMNGWADYVFKPTYKLPSLTTLKAYIDKNQHLPDMPSEAEVIKDGVNLGEMNKLLLKKVEELTLYLIKKDEQINQQGGVITKLQKQVNRLK